MLRVAIIGCGKIADSHAEQITRIEGCQLVAVCDREELMARQLADRYSLDSFFSDVEEMLRKARPDVVHITTPPQGHFALGTLCLNHGCHIYVEKPFAETTAQAVELLAVAERRGLKVTVGNDAQFTDASRRCRRLIEQNYLGGSPVHMESYYCYELRGAYAEALMGDKEHWVRRLPGKLLHNIISHGVVRIAEYIQDEAPVVIAHGFPSPLLQRLGETEILDELRVIVADRSGTTAYFTFSSQMRPSLHQLRIFGPTNGLLLDDDEHAVVKLPGVRQKSYAGKFIPHLGYIRQHLRNLARNLKLFLRNDFHMKAGMKYLMESFYSSIEKGTRLPISYREIIQTCRIMEAVFDQIYAQKTSGSKAPCTVAGADLRAL